MITFITRDLGSVIVKDVSTVPVGRFSVTCRWKSGQGRRIRLINLLPQALVAAALDPGSWSDVLDMTRVQVCSSTGLSCVYPSLIQVQVFIGCPHRSKNRVDMEERLCRLLFASYDKEAPHFIPSVSSVSTLAAAVIEINGLFVDSKALLRSRPVSIYAWRDSEPDINPVGHSLSLRQKIC